jgi:GT2 family glycosyltransferase
MKSNICSVLVTYNRLTDLKKTLKAYVAQTLRPNYLIIVDNASTDGTTEFVDDWSSKHQDAFQVIVLHSEKNLGGAGGFSLGIKKAVELECDFVYQGGNVEDFLHKISKIYRNRNLLEEYWITSAKLKSMRDHVNELIPYYGIKENNER